MLKNYGTRKNDKKGVTLVELIVVLIILAILAALLIPALAGYKRIMVVSIGFIAILILLDIINKD